MDFTRDGRARAVLAVVLIVALASTAVVAQNSLLTQVGQYVSVGDIGGLLFVAWLTVLLVMVVDRTAETGYDRE
ncbi:hypothetical protein [Halomarina rubra]|uniref:Uncharacterized protein n=1 Tax=Halomarina rubra TaxID=2071873 RepID=A0ABD6B0Y4_9EURY|nr:hypothetical protein [Halomarina rubra]